MTGSAFHRRRCEHCDDVLYVATVEEMLHDLPRELHEPIHELRGLVGLSGWITACPTCLCITTLESIPGSPH